LHELSPINIYEEKPLDQLKRKFNM